MFVWDQVISWVCIVQCWWIVQQTGQAPGNWPTFFMRAGIVGMGLGLVVVTVWRLMGQSAPWAGELIKPFLAVMLHGVIMFHWKRFARL